MALKPYQNLSTQASGSITKMRAEQIKSEDGLGSLAIDLEALRGQVKDIIGSDDYKEQIAGEYAKVQIVDLAAHFDASGASKLVVKQDADVTGAAALKSTLAVDGAATLKGATAVNATLTVSGAADFNGNVTANKISIDSDVATRLYIVDGDGSMKDESKLTFSGSELKVDGAVSGSSATFAGETVMASATVSDLTNNRVVLAGVNGSLSDSMDLQFNGAKLIVGPNKFEVVASTGETSTGDLKAVTGSFSGNLTVDGNLLVKGATTTVDTQNLLVKDAKIVISSGGIVDEAGIYLGSDSSGENIRWATADGGKWIASDKFAADVLQALDLSSALVYADASGNLTEVTATQFAGYLSAGFGISSVTTGTIVATEYTPGTGMHKAGFEFSIGQPVETSSVVQFAAVTGSNLTAVRLMASDANKVMVSADLIDWMTGSANKIDVKAEAGGKVSFDLALQLTSAGNMRLSGSYASVAAGINDLYSKAGAASKKATYTVGVGGVAKDANIAGSLSTNFIGELTADNALVFVNGQLMDGVGDYACTDGQLSFKFALEQGDLVTVKKG